MRQPSPRSRSSAGSLGAKRGTGQRRRRAVGWAAIAPDAPRTPIARLERLGRAILGICVVLAALICAWTVAFYMARWGVARWDWVLPPLVRTVATALLGLMLFGIPVSIIGIIHQPREQQTFRSLLTTLGRIAQGDFSARMVPAMPRGDHPFLQLASSINSMAEQLDRMEQLRQEFISNVSHEIQSPLTSIGGFAKALQDDEDLDPERRRRYLEIIRTESERLSKLSDNLLKLTALEADQPPLEARPYRLDRQLRRIVLALEPQWQGKSLDLQVDLRDTTIKADEALLDQVWGNLLHNAIKFTPEGGAVSVRLRERRADDTGGTLADKGPHGGYAIVEIADTGIGIAPSDQERIFERFYKADPSRNREAGGSGLGLALAKKIVGLHGGVTALHSTVGKGTTFTVRLPITPPAPRTHPSHPA